MINLNNLSPPSWFAVVRESQKKMSDVDLIHSIQEFHERTGMRFEDIWNGLSLKVGRLKQLKCQCGRDHVIHP